MITTSIVLKATGFGPSLHDTTYHAETVPNKSVCRRDRASY